MKPIIFPLIALTAVGSWHFVNANKIADLRESLDQAPSSESALPSAPINEERAFMTPEEGIDLEQFERYLSDAASRKIKSNGDNAWMWMEQQFYLMSSEDVIAFLDNLQHANIPNRTRSEIEKKIENILTDRHPKEYLMRFGIKPGFGDYPAWKAFHRFIDTDLDGAVSWFDEYVKETKLGDREALTRISARVKFELIIARKFYPQDLPALSKRLKNLSADQADAVIGGLGTDKFPEVPQEFIELARSNLPEDYAVALISNRFWNATRNKNLPEVAKIINNHQLTQREKHAFYESMTNSFGANNQGNHEKFETLLPFLKEQGIENYEKVYASGLAKFYSKELCGTGDLTPVYSYIQETGSNEDLENLFLTFVDKTTSRFCNCCSLSGRLKRISNDNLKTAISNAYRQTLNK